MKAVRVHEKGGPEVLRYENAPDPTPGPGEVLIRVRAVGINFADHLMRIGAYPAGEPPIIPGLEAAGTVDQIGPQVTGVERGQRVMAWARRSYAELTTAPTWAICPVPGNLSFEEAAALPVVFGTAWHALVTCAALQPGEWVLAHAAGSGVGSAAIQLARQLGARVITTAGADWKVQRGLELGAEHGANYTTEDFGEVVRRATDGQGVDVVLEGVGRATFPASVKSLAFGGRLVIYGAPSGPRVELDTREAINRNLTFFGMSITTNPRFGESIAAFAAEAMPWFESGALKPVIDRVYPLERAGEAHQRLMDREQFGKLVLAVG
jgi:NADPH:quinone reductase-like Zn-dependent oxidoreductase